MSKSTSTNPPSFAALAHAFFAEHLQQQRAMSPRTVAAYRDAFVLFLQFAQVRLRKQPTAITLQEITPSLILTFLDHLEYERGNAVRCQGEPKFPQVWESKIPHPVHASASSARTRPAFNFSLSRYELPRMLSVTA